MTRESDRIVAFLPLRGGSRRVERKNIQLVGGKPLWMHVYLAAYHCSEISHLFFAVDDKWIQDSVKARHMKDFSTVYRVKEMSDTCIQETPMLPFVEHTSCGHIVLLQATSPFLRAEHLSDAIAQYFDERCDSMFSGYPAHEHLWIKPTIIDEGCKRKTLLPRRKSYAIPPFYVQENGAFYITSKAAFLKSKKRLSGKIGCYMMRKEDSYQVDDHHDLYVADLIMKELRNEPTKLHGVHKQR